MKNVVIHDPENNTLSKKYIKPTNFIPNMKETKREKKDLSDLINFSKITKSAFQDGTREVKNVN